MSYAGVLLQMLADRDDLTFDQDFRDFLLQSGVDPSLARMGSVGRGWWPLLSEVFEKVRAAAPTHSVAYGQIKEKFGSLRIYTKPYSLREGEDRDAEVYDKVQSIVEEAENKSSTICERCGAPGSARSISGWTKTVCEPCCNHLQAGRKRR